MFPTSWRISVINELFKNKGLPSISKNYRGISLVQLLAKLFDFILLERFKKWFTPADEQTAYQEKKGGADHVFLLRCMMQYARRFKKKLFVISIDFDGAFDRVSRAHLILKLCAFGAGKIFSACLFSIHLHMHRKYHLSWELIRHLQIVFGYRNRDCLHRPCSFCSTSTMCLSFWVRFTTVQGTCSI